MKKFNFGLALMYILVILFWGIIVALAASVLWK